MNYKFIDDIVIISDYTMIYVKQMRKILPESKNLNSQVRVAEKTNKNFPINL